MAVRRTITKRRLSCVIELPFLDELKLYIEHQDLSAYTKPNSKPQNHPIRTAYSIRRFEIVRVVWQNIGVPIV